MNLYHIIKALQHPYCFPLRRRLDEVHHRGLLVFASAEALIFLSFFKSDSNGPTKREPRLNITFHSDAAIMPSIIVVFQVFSKTANNRNHPPTEWSLRKFTSFHSIAAHYYSHLRFIYHIACLSTRTTFLPRVSSPNICINLSGLKSCY